MTKKLAELKEAERTYRSLSQTARYYWGGNPYANERNRYIDLRNKFIVEFGLENLPEELRP